MDCVSLCEDGDDECRDENVAFKYRLRIVSLVDREKNHGHPSIRDDRRFHVSRGAAQGHKEGLAAHGDREPVNGSFNSPVCSALQPAASMRDVPVFDALSLL